MRECSFPGCGRPLCARLLCNGHYQQLRRGKDLAPIDIRYHGGMSDQERLDDKTDKSGDCWVWTGGTFKNGYGQFSFKGRKTTPHRASFILAYGSIAPGLEVDHMCRNRLCVRPAHLQAVTRSENAQNREAQSNNKLGIRGVSWHSAARKYRAQAKLNGVTHLAGFFDSAEEAACAATNLRNRLHTNNLPDHGGKERDDGQPW